MGTYKTAQKLILGGILLFFLIDVAAFHVILSLLLKAYGTY